MKGHLNDYDILSSVSLSKLEKFDLDESYKKTLTTFNNHNLAELSRQDTCGIIGVVCSHDSAVEYIFEGLQILKNRGFDSAGIATLDENNELVLSKYASQKTTSDAFDRLEKTLSIHKGHHIGIGHTRWATHGGKTDVNAHPHTDAKNRIALIHNGVIYNYMEIKKKLIENGIHFVSETDSEVVAQQIGFFLDQGRTLKVAIENTLSMLDGTWAFVIISKDEPDKMYACRNGSPLLIGVSPGKMFFASQDDAFTRHTRDMISLENGEFAVISSSGIVEIIGKTKMESDIKSRIQKSEAEKSDLSPHPHPYWTIKEILEQPMTLARALNYGGRIIGESNVRLGGLEQNKSWLQDIRNLVIAASGTSFYSALYGAMLMRHLKCFDTVQVFDAAEIESDDFPSKSGLLVISQSGETLDVVRALGVAERLSVPSFSVVNKVGSLIAKSTSCGVYVNAGIEKAVASTKAFTSQVTVLGLIAIWFASLPNRGDVNNTVKQRKQLVSALHKLPSCSGMLLASVRDQCARIAKKLLHAQTLFVLGKGYADSIAKEGSLKIKEITYCHAEAYSSGALKHGPFALLTEGVPVILICLDDEYLDYNLNAAQQVSSRKASVYCITDADINSPKFQKSLFEDIIEVPSNGPLTALLAVIPLQLIAYELSILKGIDPDHPRGLAKTVTVN